MLSISPSNSHPNFQGLIIKPQPSTYRNYAVNTLSKKIQDSGLINKFDVVINKLKVKSNILRGKASLKVDLYELGSAKPKNIFERLFKKPLKSFTLDGVQEKMVTESRVKSPRFITSDGYSQATTETRDISKNEMRYKAYTNLEDVIDNISIEKLFKKQS